MKELTVVSSELTMTSLEIAELVESRHDSVKRTIERLASSGVIELPPLVEVKNHLGQTISVYQVDKRSSYIVVAQLSPEFTARLVDRWQELENQIPQTLPEALRLAADMAEKIILLEQTAEKNLPKIQMAEAISASSKSILIREFSKVISNQSSFVIGEKNFYKWLRHVRILDTRNAPYQRYIDNNWFELRESTYENENTNGPRVMFTTMITGKGQIAVFKKFIASKDSRRFLNKNAPANRMGSFDLFGPAAEA